MQKTDLSGIWRCKIPGMSGEMRIPGTLDEAGIGFPDDPKKQWQIDEVRRIGFYRDGDPIVTRLTRKVSYEGMARITRTVSWQPVSGMRYLVHVERARHLRLTVNGKEAPILEEGGISAPWRFEITGLITGEDEFTFLSDNSMPGWPRDAIVYSSAASDETQTNWNGLLGDVYIGAMGDCFCSSLCVYPKGDFLTVIARIEASTPRAAEFRLSSPALCKTPLSAQTVSLKQGSNEIRFENLPVSSRAGRWDLGKGTLYEMHLTGDAEADVRFGLRDFRASEGALTLNGRRFFLRGEANCAVFPETGYCPMTVPEWKKILRKYRAYGVNCMRFHSHCPPEAAFAAADELGMLMQPELPHWDPHDAFGSEESRAFYQAEAQRILRMLANHPSFVMLTFGNELHTHESGTRFAEQLLDLCRKWDPTRLYANGSNFCYGQRGADPHSDFYTSSTCKHEEMRATHAGPSGWLNDPEADVTATYDSAADFVQRSTASRTSESSSSAGGSQPLFSFEVGQYETLPDFQEIRLFRGVTAPENFRHIRKKVKEKGLADDWQRRVEATGELALRCYRAEIEAAMATEGYSGISLLGLQDFPGQGTALIGMMNTHLQPKPYDFAKPERFEAFFRDVLPLALIPRFTWNDGDAIPITFLMANYGKEDLRGIPRVYLKPFSGPASIHTRNIISVPHGSLTSLKPFRITANTKKPEKQTLELEFGDHRNRYDLWVYPRVEPECPRTIYECRRLDEKAMEILSSGGRVYLAPDSTEEALPHSVPSHFSTDFWSVCTFPQQSGTMGQLIDAEHPMFQRFPTDFHTDWQWRPMACQRAFLLPRRIRSIVEVMDSYAFLRPLSQLFEARCGKGRILVSSMGLHELQEHPEARALQYAIYRYMQSAAFRPEQELSAEFIRQLVP